MVFKLFFLLLAEIGYVEPWGQDENLQVPSLQMTEERKLSPLGLFAEKAILLHHKSITHISGPRSHFRPTSSQYMLEAIRTFGFTKGYLMGCDRLLRENSDPWVYRSKTIHDALYKWDPPSD